MVTDIRYRCLLCWALTGLVAWTAPAAPTARLKDVCDVQGARSNMLIGTGLVVGLAGTGDKNPAALIAQQRALERLGIAVDNVRELKSDNSAVVMVTAELPPFAKEGTRIDVIVDSLYNCKSLEGGTLLETHLTGPGGDETVYAVAQGPVSIGGYNAGIGTGAGQASIRKNHATAGRIPGGAYVEQEVPATVTDGDRLMLLLKNPDFSTARNVQQAINENVEPATAVAFGAGAVNVTIPETWRHDLVGFIAMLEDIGVESDVPSRVVINERTGTIVVGAQVTIKPCQVAHGNLTIKIATMPVVSQPAPFGVGETVRGQVAAAGALEEPAFLMPVEGTSAGEVAAALNRIKVTPRDMISIFQALRSAGALEAELEIM